MRILAPLALIAALTTPGLALAQRNPAPPHGPPVQIIDIDEADLLVGDLKTPDGKIIRGRTPTIFDSLIELRTDFSAELLASISEL